MVVYGVDCVFCLYFGYVIYLYFMKMNMGNRFGNLNLSILLLNIFYL